MYVLPLINGGIICDLDIALPNTQSLVNIYVKHWISCANVYQCLKMVLVGKIVLIRLMTDVLINCAY